MSTAVEQPTKTVRVIEVRVAVERNPCAQATIPEDWVGRLIRIICDPIPRKQFMAKGNEVRCDTDAFWPVTDEVLEEVKQTDHWRGGRYVCRHQIQIGD